MVRFQMFMTERQMAKLKAESKRTGLAVADILRRLIDAHLTKGTKK